MLPEGQLAPHCTPKPAKLFKSAVVLTKPDREAMPPTWEALVYGVNVPALGL